MPSYDTISRLLVILSLVAYAILLLRLRSAGLTTTYRWFCGYVAAQFLRTLVLFLIPPRTNVYGWIFLLTQPVLWLFYSMTVNELYALVLTNYSGIARFGRRALQYALLAAILISSATLAADVAAESEAYRLLRAANVMERALVSTLLIFLLLMAVFVTVYPVELSRNLVVHTIVFALYFFSKNVGLLLRNVLGPAATRTVSASFGAAACLCLFAWIISMNRKGQTRLISFRRVWRDEDERRLLDKLEELNGTLVRSGRK
jgi:hypothetical protein